MGRALGTLSTLFGMRFGAVRLLLSRNTPSPGSCSRYHIVGYETLERNALTTSQGRWMHTPASSRTEKRKYPIVSPVHHDPTIP